MANAHTRPRNRRRRQSFKASILTIFTVLIAVTALSITLYSYFENHRLGLRLTSTIIDAVAEDIVDETEFYLKPVETLTRLEVAQLHGVRPKVAHASPLVERFHEILQHFPQLEMLNLGTAEGEFLMVKRVRGQDRELVKIITVLPDGQRQQSLLWRAPNGQISAVDSTQNMGAARAMVADGGELLQEQYDPRERPWYRGAATAKGQYWTNVYAYASDGQLGVTTAAPILDKGGEVLGVLSADITLTALSTILGEIQSRHNAMAFIFDGQGQLIAYPGYQSLMADGHQDPRPVLYSELQEKPVVEAIRAFSEGRGDTFSFRSDDSGYLARFARPPKSLAEQWTIGVLFSERDYVQELDAIHQRILVISLGVLVLALLGGLRFAKALSQPIEEITEQLRKVKNFELEDVRSTDSYIREVHEMSRAIDSMKSGLMAFRRYLPSTLVRQLIASGEEAVIGGKMREITLFFSDITSFTSISEGMPPKELMVDLSEYFEIIHQEIAGRHGVIDKFIGDAVMAFWGAPVALEDHAVNACAAALAIQRNLDVYNAGLEAKGKEPMRTRIGIHTGYAIVGNVGYRERMNYTALGDAVNLASRLESVNKLYGTRLLISHATYRYVRGRVVCRPLDVIAVKGKSEGTRIYELMAMADEEQAGVLQEKANAFALAFDRYLARDWVMALEAFRALTVNDPEDRPSRIFVERCEHFLVDPPDKEWSGVTRLTSK